MVKTGTQRQRKKRRSHGRRPHREEFCCAREFWEFMLQRERLRRHRIELKASLPEGWADAANENEDELLMDSYNGLGHANCDLCGTSVDDFDVPGVTVVLAVRPVNTNYNARGGVSVSW